MPLRFLLFILLALSNALALPFFSSLRMQTPFTIMLDPAGDAQHPGRQLDYAYERGITLQCAERLKSVLEEQFSNLRVIITRQPGETLQPLQNANFANRLDVNLFVTLHFYQEAATKPRLYLYHFSYGDEAVTKMQDLAFYPYDQAYLFNAQATHTMITNIQQRLAAYKKQFDCKGPYKLPLKPLIGIKAPAIVIEAGLKHKDDWVGLIEPLMMGIVGALKL